MIKLKKKTRNIFKEAQNKKNSSQYDVVSDTVGLLPIIKFNPQNASCWTLLFFQIFSQIHFHGPIHEVVLRKNHDSTRNLNDSFLLKKIHKINH